MNKFFPLNKRLALAFLLIILAFAALPASAAQWEFVLLWQQPIDGGVAAIATGNLKGDAAAEIAVATWQNDIRILSCSGAQDTSFSAPPTRGNVTLLTIGHGAKENFVVAATLWQPFVAAYAPDGRRLWEYEDLKKAGVTGITAVHSSASDLVAVSYTSKPGVRLLDKKGGIVATTPKVSSAFFVAGLDCDGDGKEEMLSNAEKSAEKSTSRLACYNQSGNFVKSVSFPGYPSLAITADVNNDGKKDIISYCGVDTITLGVWSRSGNEIWTAKLGKMSAPSALVAADFDGDDKKEIAAAFPLGQIMIFKDAKQMAAVQSQQKFPRIAAADVDSDGQVELLVGDGKGLRAFKVGPKASSE